MFFEFQTPMVSYVNVHAILEGRRDRAKKSPSDDSVLSQVILFYFIGCFMAFILCCQCIFFEVLFFMIYHYYHEGFQNLSVCYRLLCLEERNL